MYGYGYRYGILKVKFKLETNPFTDDLMIWDSETRQYYLTKKALPNVEFDSEEEYNLETKRISDNFYNYIYTESCEHNNDYNKRDILEYLYAKDTKLRKAILQALQMFFKYDLSTNGGTDSIYFGNDLEIPRQFKIMLHNLNLIRQGILNYEIEFMEGDFDEAKEHKNTSN